MNLPVNAQFTRTTLALAELSAYLGQEVAVSDWLTIDREHRQLFAVATYLTDADVDLQFSRNNRYGADLAAWCRTRLANYKISKQISITTTLPLLPVGKIDKQA